MPEIVAVARRGDAARGPAAAATNASAATAHERHL
jgi:hypothetical protein